MAIVGTETFNILNYSDSLVTAATTHNKSGYRFEPAIEDEPSIKPLAFSEIIEINSQTKLFREGILRFEESKQKELYKELAISDWESILSESEIRNIILQPTKEGLEKFIKLNSAASFERVRGILTVLDNSGMYDISSRVKSVIAERHREITLGKRGSEIIVQATKTEQPVIDVEKLKEELAQQIRKEEYEKMKAEILAELKKESKSANSRGQNQTQPATTSE